MKSQLTFILQQIARFQRYIKQALMALTPRRIIEEVALVIIVLLIGVFGVNAVNRDEPVLGLRLDGQVIGQLVGEDFRKRTDAIIHEREYKSLSVQVADQTSHITLRQLGVDIDEKQIQTTLLKTGREGSMLKRFIDQNLALFGGRTVTLQNTHFNTEQAKAYIATLDQKIDIPPVNAYFSYENQQVILHTDSKGRVIDGEAALENLRSARPETNDQIEFPIKQTTAPVTSSMLSPLLPEVQAIAQKPLTIVAGNSRTTLSPEQLVSLMVPKVIPDPSDTNKTTVQITFDEAKLNAVLDEVIKRAVVAPQPTIIRGGVVVQQGRSGIRTEDSHSLARILTPLVQRQTRAAQPDEAHVPLVTVDPPVVHQVVSAPVRTRTGTGLVRLTFDDGPGAYTEQILDILKRYNVHATFYVIGRNVQSYPGTMQRIKNEGHTIGNHSFTHADLARLSSGGVTQELANTQTAVQRASGVTPTRFRPPYGSYNATVSGVAASLGMSLDMWSVDTRDWAQPGSGVITRRVLEDTGPGAVVLLHVLYQQTVNALPSIIEGVRAQGYTLE